MTNDRSTISIFRNCLF